MGQIIKLFCDGDPYHIETSRLVCSANQWISFYMIGTSDEKEITEKKQVLGNALTLFFLHYVNKISICDKPIILNPFLIDSILYPPHPLPGDTRKSLEVLYVSEQKFHVK